MGTSAFQKGLSSIFLAILALILIIGAVVADRLMVTRRSYEEFDDKITEQRYKDKKVIRVYLKTDVSNTQAEVLIKEFQKIEGVNGTWYVSKSLLEENSKKSDKTSSPEISAIIDVFIEEPSLKGIVIETIQENDYVQKVEDLN